MGTLCARARMRQEFLHQFVTNSATWPVVAVSRLCFGPYPDTAVRTVDRYGWDVEDRDQTIGESTSDLRARSNSERFSAGEYEQQ